MRLARASKFNAKPLYDKLSQLEQITINNIISSLEFERPIVHLYAKPQNSFL